MGQYLTNNVKVRAKIKVFFQHILFCFSNQRIFRPGKIMKKLILLSFLLWVGLITGLPETGLSRQKRQSGRANVQVNRSGSRGRQTVASKGSVSGRATVQVSLLALTVKTLLFI